MDVGRALKHGGAERQDSLAVGGTTFREHCNDSVRVLPQQILDIDQFGIRRRARLDRSESHHDGAKQADALQAPSTRVGYREDGVEDGGEVDGVDRARKVGRNDRAWVREALARLIGQGASLHAVKLQVHPPDARDGHHAPEGDFAGDHGKREVVKDQEVADGIGEEEW